MTTAQLATAGVDRGEIARGLAQGWLRRRHRGVYLLGPVESPLARYAAALLAVGPDAAVSHTDAAALSELLPPTAGDVHVTTSRRTRRRQGIRVHLTTALPRGDVRLLHHLRVTSAERTLRDLAKARHPDLERVAAEAHARRLVTQAALDTIVGGQDPSFTRSEAERRLLAVIRAANLPTPHTNVRVGGYRVIRITWRQLQHEPHAVVARLAAALAHAAA